VAVGGASVAVGGASVAVGAGPGAGPGPGAGAAAGLGCGEPGATWAAARTASVVTKNAAPIAKSAGVVRPIRSAATLIMARSVRALDARVNPRPKEAG